MLKSLPEAFPDRAAFVTAVMQQGYDRNVALWLSMNLRAEDSHRYTLQYDLKAIEELLDDYFQRDFWAELETPSAGRQMHFVVAEKSDVVDEGDRRRLRDISAGRTDMHLHFLADAGHWLHVDAPDALRALLVTGLSGSAD